MALQILQSQKLPILAEQIFRLLTRVQREATATIKNPPQAYTHASPPKKQNIVEFDCRGLEFTEFKSDACSEFPVARAALLTPW